MGGTILAGELAVEKGWAINLGGGFHHCSSEKGGGFSPYADITILIHCLFKCFTDKIKKVMIVDLDAHQVLTRAYITFVLKHVAYKIFSCLWRI